mmetsp:Transcript_22607/g.42049  ORF Transcript_22607/g.42049 Transcript_22607/m.42049 type:complete len:334 (+) Transcript_22607:536-1537(+)
MMCWESKPFENVPLRCPTCLYERVSYCGRDPFRSYWEGVIGSAEELLGFSINMVDPIIPLRPSFELLDTYSWQLQKMKKLKRKDLSFFFYQMDSSSMVFHDEQEQVMFSRLFESVPLRVSALHMCLPDDASPQILQVKHRAMRSFGPVARVRARFHVGTHSVVQSSIETFGISSDVLPLSNTGGLKTQNHLKWIGMRRLREDAIFRVAGRDGIAGSNHPAQHLSFSWIECPGLYDVLLGRGKPKMNHVGNVAMRAIVMSKVNQYISATKQERIDIIEEVLLEIRASGGRFLKEDQNMHGYWSEVDVETARQKVGIFFRDIRSNTGPKASAAKK